MWQKSHTVITRDATQEQMWKLFSNVNDWSNWHTGVVSTSIVGPFEAGNHFYLQPKRWPKVKIEILEARENEGFTDLTRFPLARMYGKHTFEETSEGLKITTTMSVEWILSFLWIKLVAQDIVDTLPTDMPHQVIIASQL